MITELKNRRLYKELTIKDNSNQFRASNTLSLLPDCPRATKVQSVFSVTLFDVRNHVGQILEFLSTLGILQVQSC